MVPSKFLLFIGIHTGKGKSVPLQAWSGPDDSRNFRFHRPGVAQRVPGNSGSTGLEWPRGFQEVKVPIFHNNGTGRW